MFNDPIKQGNKNLFYLTTHSTHFIYGVGHMVKNNSDSNIGNPLQGLLFSIGSKGSFIFSSIKFLIFDQTIFMVREVRYIIHI